DETVDEVAVTRGQLLKPHPWAHAIHLGESFPGPLEGAELGVAVGTPRTPLEQDHAVVAVQGVRQLETIPAGEGDRQGGELIARMKQCHGSHPFWHWSLAPSASSEVIMHC